MINLIGCNKENFFKLLELMQYKRKKIEDSKELCAICHDSMEQSEETKMPNCPHHFHAGCILKWCNKKKSGREMPT